MASSSSFVLVAFLSLALCACISEAREAPTELQTLLLNAVKAELKQKKALAANLFKSPELDNMVGLPANVKAELEQKIKLVENWEKKLEESNSAVHAKLKTELEQMKKVMEHFLKKFESDEDAFRTMVKAELEQKKKLSDELFQRIESMDEVELAKGLEAEMKPLLEAELKHKLQLALKFSKNLESDNSVPTGETKAELEGRVKLIEKFLESLEAEKVESDNKFHFPTLLLAELKQKIEIIKKLESENSLSAERKTEFERVKKIMGEMVQYMESGDDKTPLFTTLKRELNQKKIVLEELLKKVESNQGTPVIKLFGDN